MGKDTRLTGSGGLWPGEGTTEPVNGFFHRQHAPAGLLRYEQKLDEKYRYKDGQA